MPKIPECDRCRFYSGNFYLICAVVPGGPEDNLCHHFAPDPDIEIEKLWEPQGARYVNNELVIERSCSGEEIIQLDLTLWHPMHTGRCPRCDASFDRDYTALVHWDCPECGWKDDSV
jgi:hypothetical protein